MTRLPQLPGLSQGPGAVQAAPVPSSGLPPAMAVLRRRGGTDQLCEGAAEPGAAVAAWLRAGSEAGAWAGRGRCGRYGLVPQRVPPRRAEAGGSSRLVANGRRVSRRPRRWAEVKLLPAAGAGLVRCLASWFGFVQVIKKL